jgi:hypothetical protein
MIAQPSVRNAAFPGALLMLAGAFLIVWALNDWGVFTGGSSATGPKTRRTLPKPTEDTHVPGSGR